MLSKYHRRKYLASVKNGGVVKKIDCKNSGLQIMPMPRRLAIYGQRAEVSGQSQAIAVT
jgi:hypothetical protein